MINEVDKELENQGPRFVRYADDLVILCKSKRSAERTLTNITPFIENELFLKVNKEKTVVAYISNVKFLGYSFYIYRKEGRLRLHPNAITKMKA
jgi:retron-type reverse transcriptase